jgi:uncharacterized membrane protein HdeD (DUF308 family)
MATSDTIAPGTDGPTGRRFSTLFQRRWGWLLALGLVQIISGAFALIIPVAASVAAAIVFGAVLLVSGVSQIVHAFSVRRWKGTVLHALGGLLYVAAGAFVLFFPVAGVLTLSVIVGTLLIADGVVRSMLAYRLKPADGWGWFLAGGMASTALGVLLLVGWPFAGFWAIGILLGAFLLFSGLSNCVLAFSFRAHPVSDAEDPLEHAQPHA